MKRKSPQKLGPSRADDDDEATVDKQSFLLLLLPRSQPLLFLLLLPFEKMGFLAAAGKKERKKGLESYQCGASFNPPFLVGHWSKFRNGGLFSFRRYILPVTHAVSTRRGNAWLFTRSLLLQQTRHLCVEKKKKIKRFFFLPFSKSCSRISFHRNFS